MSKEKQPNIVKQHDKRSGQTHLYESISYWDPENNQSRAKRKLIGKLDPDTGEVVPTDGRMKKKKAGVNFFSPLSDIQRVFYGATDVLAQIAKQVGLKDDLKAIFPNDYASLLSLAYYLVLALSSSMQRFSRWAELHHLPKAANELTSQRISNLFQRLTEKEKQAFFKAQVARQTEDSYWFYDTTSISSYIELHIILGRKYSSGILLNEYQQFS